jgi:hypothetical protein
LGLDKIRQSSSGVNPSSTAGHSCVHRISICGGCWTSHPSTTELLHALTKRLGCKQTLGQTSRRALVGS